MTDTTSNDRKISVSFSRKISDGNYGTTEATAWVQSDTLGADLDPIKVGDLLGELFMVASVAVFDQLGVEHELDPESMVVREKHAPNVTNVATAQAAIERVFGPGTSSASAGSVRVMNPNEQDGPLPAWLEEACARDGITAVWDNRRKAAGTKQPLFKEAVARGGTGHGKDGEPKPFWPPK
jgi:hypothetical protein